MDITDKKEDVLKSGMMPFATAIILTEYASVGVGLARVAIWTLGSILLIAIASTFENRILWITVCVLLAWFFALGIYNFILVRRKVRALATMRNQTQAEVEKWLQFVAHKLEASEASVSPDELADYRDRQYLLRLAEMLRIGHIR